jgi:hypothetical protein
VTWSEPKAIFEAHEGFWGTRDFWAPEVHFYNGKFFLFASFTSDTTCRGTAILICDTPDGEFKPHSDGAITPKDWECLDGTFYVDQAGTPYMVFCHEWLQVDNATMCTIPLSDDLSTPLASPRKLFAAADFPFVRRCPAVNNHPGGGFVTDGPFLHRCQNGDLLMIWSSFGEKGYLQSVLRSDNGKLSGKWLPQKLLFEQDGGHGMIFKSFDHQMYLALHHPNCGPERLTLFPLTEENGTLQLL